VSVPSDATLLRSTHASIQFMDGQFYLLDSSESYHAAVRCGVGHAAREWPLSPTVCFSAGNSVFSVEEVDVSRPLLRVKVSEFVSEANRLGRQRDGRRPECKPFRVEHSPFLTHLSLPPSPRDQVKTGPKRGTTININNDGATIGRANDNFVCIPDRELSRRHSCVSFRDGGFYLSDLQSTNGTYVQLVGPYAGRYPLNLNDHILVGRTGFSINRFDYGLSEEIGMRRTMEDKSIIVQDVLVPELSGTPALAPQTWMAVYDGHGGVEASAFLHQRLHMEVSLSLARAAPRLLEAFAEGGRGGGGMGAKGEGGGLGGVDAAAAMPHDAVVKEAMSEAFLACDADFIANHGSAGSTATTVLMLGQRAYCCNVGDSRTVLSRAGRALALSSDHKPSREDEAARIKAAGGFIINKRVMGELAVSRAFGDSDFKKGIREILGEENTSAGAKDESAEDQDQDLTKPLVVADPEVSNFEATVNKSSRE
jgi:serine/threonine protein phosphatase PrpC